MKLKVFLVAVVVLFLGCENDEPTAPTLLLTLIVEDTFYTKTTDNWVIIHDEDGVPIAFESFESGDAIQLKTNSAVKGNVIGVTVLKYSNSGGKKEYLANTYLQYEKGGALTLDSFVAEPFPSGTTTTGTFDVTVNSTDPLHQYSVTNMFAVGESRSQYNGTNFTFTGYTSELPSKYLVQASDLIGNARYKMLDNIQPNSSFTFDFDELLEYDKTVEFTFPASNNVFFSVVGREEDQSIENASYLHHLHFSFDPSDAHTSIRSGYLNSLTGYVTSLSVGYPSHKLFYHNKGSIPEAKFPILSPDDYIVSSKDITSFLVNTTNPFIYRSSLFSYTDAVGNPPIISWYVYSSSNSHTLQGLPEEILASHPLVDLANVNHIHTSFYVESLPYQKAILAEWQKDKYISRGITIY